MFDEIVEIKKEKNSHQNFKEKEGRTNGGLSKSIVVE
jgi:hypothetical protein